MDTVFTSPERQGLLLLYSLALGAVLGLLFGLIRFPFEIVKQVFILRGKKRVFPFVYNLISDISQSVVYTAAVVLFIYAANEGVIRYFMIASSFAGTALYHISLGRLLLKASAAAALPVHAFSVFIYKGIKNLLRPLYGIRENKKVKLYIISKIRTSFVRR